MEYHGAGDVDVAEADRLAALKAHKEVDSWVGARGGGVPDGFHQTGVIGRLALFLAEDVGARCRGYRGGDGLVGDGGG